MHTFYCTQETTNPVKDNPPEGGDIPTRLIFSELCNQIETKISWEITLKNKADPCKGSFIKNEPRRMEPEFIPGIAFLSTINRKIINHVKILSGQDTFNQAFEKIQTDSFNARGIVRNESEKLTHQLYEDGN